ncbi:DUF3656 domain-containing protein [Candidatus Woesearchaeota archaeon]|nr:DUF3656 domain-containing protein [Candidatus Woesearchaeota archaeon]
MSKAKLISPAGDFDCLVAAVSNGADAVYLGSKLFNARRLANNFSGAELRKAVQYAHLHGVEIHLTLNTLIKNQEIVPFLNQVSIAAQLGVDALIMQDLTFAPLIKAVFPNLKIHASTQSTLMNTAAVEYWKKYVDVFVLSRELSSKEIKPIYDNTGAKLEVFVHGHLCSSYSGQCLISSLIGSRSGNRGMCASSCRKKYNGKYLLSAKDLSLVSNIKEVLESGVSILKIEGRMKSAEYVATTTRYYRQQMDAYYEKKQNNLTNKDYRNLKLAFNRDFTSGYFFGEKTIIDPTIPSKRGILLGQVVKGELWLKDNLQKFDGISIVYNGESSGGFVRQIKIGETEVESAKKGQKVKLSFPEFKNGALVFLLSPQDGEDLLGKTKLVDFNLDLEIKEGSNPLFRGEVLGKKFSFTLPISASRPLKHPLSREELLKDLSRFSSQIFYLKNLSVETDNSFFPKSELTKFKNELDQKLLDLLVPLDLNSNKKTILLPNYVSKSGIEKRLHVQVYNLLDIGKALKGSADVIYFDVFSKDVFGAQKIVTAASKDFFVYTPMALHDKDLNRVEEIIGRLKPEGVLVNNVGLLPYLLKNKLKFIFGYQMNIFNDQQLNYYGCSAVASIELTALELSQFKDKADLIYYAHGRPVVMTFNEEIANQDLLDEKNYLFPLRHTATSTEMLFSRKIGLLQNTSEILKAGITQLFLDLDDGMEYGKKDGAKNDAKDVFELVSLYRKLLNGENVNIQKFKRNVTVGNLRKGVM